MSSLFYDASLIMMFSKLTGGIDYSWITILLPSGLWLVWLLICSMYLQYSLKRACRCLNN